MSNQKAILKYVVHLMLLIPFLVSFVNFDSALSGPLPPNMPQIGTIVQSEEVLSTPDLIQQAFMRGEIVEDERLLYLAYALGDSNKLPTRFYSNVPWSGTMVALELNNILQSTSAKVIQNNSTMMTLQQFLSGDCGPFSGDLPNVVSTAHFYIEYDNILGGLDINDYVYALESAWNGEILNFGWAAPPVLDSNPPPGNLYHVRIQTLSIPGGAFQSGSHAGLIGDNPNTSWNDIDAYASCIVLNRDYSAFLEFGTRQEVLSITVAHELTHAIQYGYGALTGSNALDLSFIESSATWMEEEIFETADVSIVDQRLWPRFDMCMGQYHYDGAPLEFYYSYWNVFRGLTERFGVGISGGGEDVMQDFWEETSKSANSNMLSALNTALVNKGTTLADAYHDYAIAVKFNKACGGGYVYPYCLKESPEYVQAVGAVPVHGKISAVGNSYAGGLADNYSLNWISLPTRGIYSVTMENKSEFGGQFRVSIVADTGSSLQVTPLPDVVIGNSRTILAEYQPPDGAKSVVAVITNQSQTSDNPFLCFSNPYKLSVARPISFVIDDTGSMANEISMVKTTVTQKVDEFVTKSVFPNYHLLTYKDVENYRGETADPNTIKSWVNSLGASGGGDCPEEMLGALNRIAIEAPYSEAWVLTDAGFHGGVADVARTIFNLQNVHIKTHFIVYSWCFEESSSSTLSAEVESTATDQSEDGQDSLALVSELTTLALGPESFVQIANETGGHYFQISSAETQAAASILLNEMVATSDLAHFTDEVVSTSPKIYSISIDSTATEANFLLNVFRAYPNNPAARKAMSAQAKCRKAR